MAARALALLVLVLGTSPLCAQPATERYAPAQIGMAQELLERAHAVARLGDRSRAGRLAWQASLDARLAWEMSESPALRAEAAALFAQAQRYVRYWASSDSSERW